MKLPSPTTFLFWRADFDFGRIPGPVAIAVDGDQAFVAAGGYGESLVLRTRDARWQRCGATKARGLRSIFAEGELVIVAGEYGALARSTDGGATFSSVSGFGADCLYGLSRDAARTLWAGSDRGVFRSTDDGSSWSFEPIIHGRSFRVVPRGPAGGLVVASRAIVALDAVLEPLLFDEASGISDAAYGPAGLLVVGAGGKAWLACDGTTFERISLDTALDLDRVLATPDGYIVAGGRGALWTSADGRTFTATRVAENVTFSALAMFREGLLAGAYRTERAPNRFVGALMFLGDVAGVPHPTHAVRAPLPVATPATDDTSPLVAVLADRARWASELTEALVCDAFAAGLDPNTRVEKRGDSTLLHLAVQARSANQALLPLAILEVLLSHGADVDALDSIGRTPLMVAPVSEDPKQAEAAARGIAIMRRLISAGARVMPSSSGGDITGTLHYTSLPLEAYALLHEAGASVDQLDDRGRLPLHGAAHGGRNDKVVFLLDHGADPNALDGGGLTPLATALRTREEPWVPHNKLTAQFDAVIATLKARGAQDVRPFDWDGTAFGPRPLPDLGDALPRSKRGCRSLQDLVAQVRHDGEPEQALALAKRLGEALGEPRTLKIDGGLDFGRRPFFWHGDLEVSGDLDFTSPAIVTGSVRVGGVIFDAGNDSCVTIGGDVDCRGFYSSGDFAIARTLSAREVVLGYYNDFVLVADMIRAPVVIEDDHAVNAGVESPHHFDIDRYAQGHGDGVVEELHALFVDEVFDEEGQLDNIALFEKLRAGERVRRM